MTLPQSQPDPDGVDPTTRLVLARLASGASRLAGEAVHRAPSGRFRVRFPSPRPEGGGPTRVEAGALAVALVAATLVGAAMPGSKDARAQAVVRATVPAVAPAPVAATTAAADASSDAGGSDASADAATTDAAVSTDDPIATPAIAAGDAATTDTSGDEAATGDGGADDAAGEEGDGTDPLAGGEERLDQVALVVVHGDAPAAWATAPAGSTARTRADRGTTLTGVAAIPGAPLVNALGLVAGQASNPATRAGCAEAPGPLAPGTLDDLGRAAGTGCDYPAGTPSLPTAVAIDGRRWRAYAPVASSDAPAALCGTGSPTGTAAAYAASSPLRRLTDLTTSGACEAAAAPLSALAADLKADDAPAWLLIEVGTPGGSGDDDIAARERDLDAALTTLRDGLGDRSAVIVVGDGAAAELAAAPTDALPASPADPDAPAPVLSGALLLGPAVAAKATDPLPLSAYALARTQADWLGLDPPGWARAEGVSGLAIPSN